MENDQFTSWHKVAIKYQLKYTNEYVYKNVLMQSTRRHVNHDERLVRT
jgi:hypothetical protein